MPSKKQASKKSSQIMDVSKPGKSAPSASSRPIIVGRKPILKDPMMQKDTQKDGGDEKPSGDSEEHQITVTRTGSKVVTPLTILDKSGDAEDTAGDQEDAQGTAPPLEEPNAPDGEDEAEDETEADTVDETLPEPEEPEPPVDEATTASETPTDAAPSKEKSSAAKDSKDASKDQSKNPKDDSSSKDSALVDAVAGPAALDKDGKDGKDAKLNEEIQKHQAAIDKLVEDKKYFVHTSQTTKTKRRTRWLALLLVLVLLAGAYLALDAQVIKNDIQLPYEFFKEKEQPTVPSATPSPSQNQDNQTVPQPQKEEYKIPEGYVVYENADTGFKFAYPKEWGSPRPKKDPEERKTSLYVETPEIKTANIQGTLQIWAAPVEHFILGAMYHGATVKPVLSGSEYVWKVVQGNSQSEQFASGDTYTPAPKIAHDKDGVKVYDFPTGHASATWTSWAFKAGDSFVGLKLPYNNPSFELPQAKYDAEKAKYQPVLDKILQTIRIL